MAEFAPRVSSRIRNELREFSEVLDHCCEVEFIFCPVWSPETQAVEADNSFQMREQHLDLSAGISGRDERISLGDVAGHFGDTADKAVSAASLRSRSHSETARRSR